jgi:hypothetical protein
VLIILMCIMVLAAFHAAVCGGPGTLVEEAARRVSKRRDAVFIMVLYGYGVLLDLFFRRQAAFATEETQSKNNKRRSEEDLVVGRILWGSHSPLLSSWRAGALRGRLQITEEGEVRAPSRCYDNAIHDELIEAMDLRYYVSSRSENDFVS